MVLKSRELLVICGFDVWYPDLTKRNGMIVRDICYPIMCPEHFQTSIQSTSCAADERHCSVDVTSQNTISHAPFPPKEQLSSVYIQLIFKLPEPGTFLGTFHSLTHRVSHASSYNKMRGGEIFCCPESKPMSIFLINEGRCPSRGLGL